MRCTGCQEPLSAEHALDSSERSCPSCEAPLSVYAFPALFRPLSAGVDPEPVLADDASCFQHALHRALVPCDRCGRFLCSLCDLAISGQHLCPGCWAALEAEGSPRLVRERIRYDGVAVSLAIFPMLIFYITIFTAPMVLGLVAWKWRAPLSVRPVGRWQFVAAAMLALLQIAGWILLAGALAWGALQGGRPGA